MKTYRYRKHILWMKHAIPAMLVLVTFFVTLKLIVPGRDSMGIGIVLASVLIIEAWVIWWFFGKLARVKVRLTEDGIDYRGKKCDVAIPFEEISEIQQPSIRYTGGWIKVISTRETIRLTVVLEGISEFVRKLKEALDGRQLSDKYDRAKLFQFYKTATYADQSWSRIYEIFFRMLLLLLSGGAIGVVIALLKVQQKGNGFLLVLYPAAVILYVLLCYVLTEMQLARHFAKATSEERFSVPERDLGLEQRIYRRAIVIGGVLAAALLATAVLLF